VGEFESSWEAAGRRVAPSLDGVAAVLVVGDDPVATAAVALGIGRVQALRRRVAVGDLIGDVPPLQSLVEGDDPHGISDSFVYGVSLNRIARQIDRVGNLYILPSGSESVLHEEILRNDRWRRLASGFREVDALLLLAAPAEVPGIEHLIGMLDGVVLVGGARSANPSAPVIAEVRTAARRQAGAAAAERAAAAEAPVAAPAAARWTNRWRAAAAVGLVIGSLGAGLLFARDRLSGGRARPAAPLPADSAAGAVADTSTRIETLPGLTPANPADSAAAAGYAVQLVNANTPEGALALVREPSSRVLPALTYSPYLLGANREQWFRVISGAFHDRRQADSLALTLRRNGRVSGAGGAVIQVPLAFMLAGPVSRDSVVPIVASFLAKGVPAYAMRQPDGTTHVLAGAFETPSQAALLDSTLKSLNVYATLVYRVGSAF
jgi:sporulation related protein